MLMKVSPKLCHSCRKGHKLRPCDGVCLCPIDQGPISIHCQHGYCPDGKFPVRGLGTMIAWWFARLGLSRLYLKMRPGGDCRCGARAAWLDRVTVPIVNTAKRLWRKLREAKGGNAW